MVNQLIICQWFKKLTKANAGTFTLWRMAIKQWGSVFREEYLASNFIRVLKDAPGGLSPIAHKGNQANNTSVFYMYIYVCVCVHLVLHIQFPSSCFPPSKCLVFESARGWECLMEVRLLTPQLFCNITWVCTSIKTHKEFSQTSLHPLNNL